MINFLDTSAILNGAMEEYENIYISPLSVRELENIKISQKDEHIRYLARAAVREILFSNRIQCNFIDEKKIQKIYKKFPFLLPINDHHIIAEALELAYSRIEPVHFITSDGSQKIYANCFYEALSPIYYYKEKEQKDLYCGWGKYYPNTEQMASLYAAPQHNVLGAKINEYCEIFEGSDLKDILRWDGERYRPLVYHDLKNKFLNETIRPLNLEQKMAFDLLQNRNIPVKLLSGVPGGGKDYLMFLHAWELVQSGEKDKIIFVRNLVPFKDAPEIGFLQGTLQEKIAWGLGPIISILGEEGLQMAEEAGQIEAVNLGFIRGVSWNNTILYVSEGQNITGGGYKLLVSRCGKNSELWVNGDILQTDNKKFENNNGIERMINSWSDNKLFGTVKMLKTERSEVAELAASL